MIVAVIIRDEGPNRPGRPPFPKETKKMWDILSHSFHKIRPPVGRPYFAERVGFKPTVRQGRTPDFESGPFDHSGIFPNAPAKIQKKYLPQALLLVFYNSWIIWLASSVLSGRMMTRLNSDEESVNAYIYSTDTPAADRRSMASAMAPGLLAHSR